MIINANRSKNSNYVIDNRSDYVRNIGSDKFFDHFIVSEENYNDVISAINTAPNAALMYMVQTRINSKTCTSDDPVSIKLVDELTKRLCKDEAEYKKYFSAEACEG